MRTTVRIDDEILDALKDRARRDKVSFARALDRAIRDGLRTTSTGTKKAAPFRERVKALGAPRVALHKALALAAALEDEEVVREMAVRK